MTRTQISNNIPLMIMYDGIEKDFKQQKTILLIKNNNANTPEATLLFIVILLSGNVILNVPINVQYNEKPPNIETIKLDSVIAHQL